MSYKLRFFKTERERYQVYPKRHVYKILLRNSIFICVTIHFL
jgi:hypothetical protein